MWVGGWVGGRVCGSACVWKVCVGVCAHHKYVGKAEGALGLSRLVRETAGPAVCVGVRVYVCCGGCQSKVWKRVCVCVCVCGRGGDNPKKEEGKKGRIRRKRGEGGGKRTLGRK